MIGCWYKYDIYSHHLNSIINALNKKNDISLKLVTSNCNCFSSSQRYSISKDELLNEYCKSIKIPYAPINPTKKYGLLKYYIVKYTKLNFFLETFRGIAFFNKTKNCNIVHFDQVLRSFGVLSFLILLLLSKFFRKKMVVTVHELDPLQEKYNSLNRYYNKADKIIVFSDDFKNELINSGIKGERIEVVPFSVSLQPLTITVREQFIYFGGHKLLKGKGFDTLLNALKILRDNKINIKVLVYVGEGCIGLEEGKKMASDMGLDKFIIWSEFLYGSKLAYEYQKSIGCLIPYTSGSGRYPATCAMANATPVIATRKASLPEYLGELGIYIKENSSDELANEMINLIENPDFVNSLGLKLRKRAEELFSADIVANKILKVYNEVSAIKDQT